MQVVVSTFLKRRFLSRVSPSAKICRHAGMQDAPQSVYVLCVLFGEGVALIEVVLKASCFRSAVCSVSSGYDRSVFLVGSLSGYCSGVFFLGSQTVHKISPKLVPKSNLFLVIVGNTSVLHFGGECFGGCSIAGG